MKRNVVCIAIISLVLLISGCAKQNCMQCACNSNLSKEEIKAKEAIWKSLNEKTVSLYQQGKVKEAILAANQSLEYANKNFGEAHTKTATALNNLGELYRLQGKLYDAEKNYKKSLSIREKIFGKDNLDVALSYNNLASVYFAEKKFDKSEELYKKSVDILKLKLKVYRVTVMN